jgi:integrase
MDNSIRQLALRVVEKMREAGYSPTTCWGHYIDSLLPVVKYHESRGATAYDPDIAADYARDVESRKERGKIKRGHRAYLLDGAEKMSRIHDTDKLAWSFPVRVSKFELNEYYEQLLAEYAAHYDLHPNTRGDVVWMARSFFSWLVQENYAVLDDVSASEIQAFVIHCAGFMTTNSMRNVQLYMRKLCAYLHGRGLLSNSYTALLTMKTSHETKMYPAAQHGEIVTVLNQIDRSTTQGKRDYAIILLGAVTGLRAVDVRNLKLGSIDWRGGEVRVMQSKTGRTNILPLTEDVGAALEDYILHARPNSIDDNVFLRLRPPFTALYDSWSVGDVYDRYRKQAGLPREAFDGKGFHSLRRALGKNMITGGVTVEDAAQTMGDTDIDSMKKYIALDSEHLAEVALGFSGIEVSGGVAQ